MCRMLGIVTKVETEKEIFENFRQQCLTGCVKSTHQEPGHNDGWGLAFLKDGELEVVKSGKDARGDKLFEETYPVGVKSPILIGHIRKATDPRTRGVAEFSHPFDKEGWVFAHNGSVNWEDQVKRTYPHLIDSQIVLEVILAKIRGEQNIFGKIKEVIRDIIENERLSSLNFLLTNGKSFICYRFFDDSDSENERYYTLYQKMSQNRIMIASEPVDGKLDGWQLLKPGQLLMIEQDLQVKSEVLNFQRISR